MKGKKHFWERLFVWLVWILTATCLGMALYNAAVNKWGHAVVFALCTLANAINAYNLTYSFVEMCRYDGDDETDEEEAE